MSSASDEAICSTRLELPILSLVMHATACKARINYACLETCQISRLRCTVNQTTHSQAHGTTIVTLLYNQNIVLENKER